MSIFVFPGQGSQYVGMAKDFYDNFDLARKTLQEVEEYIGINLREVIFEDKKNLLNLTNYTQISIFVTSVIIFKVYQNELNQNPLSSKIMMGHSLGEYTALACSNKLSLKDCSIILKKRGELMNSAIEPNKTGMAALIGLSSHDIEEIIKKNNLNLEIANDNSPIQVVISGDFNEIINNEIFFKENGVKKYVILNVSAAFHSKYMSNAQSKLSSQIENLVFNDNKIELISNYNAEISNNSLAIKNALQKQMANRVRWTESIKKLEQVGENKIIEIGPNKVLSGLIKRISSNFDIKSINKITDLN